jgi:raffinose/stachyose/melibiose transport system permease protein
MVSERAVAGKAGGPPGPAWSASQPARRVARRTTRRWRSVLWVVPGLAVVLVFVYYPLLLNFRYSVEKSNIFTGTQTFVGLANYSRMMADPVFWRSLLNNVLYAAISIVFQVAFALVLAALIESQVRSGRWRAALRAIYFLPSAMSLTVTGLLFSFIYQPQAGLLNGILRAIGLDSLQHAWLGNSSTAMLAIIAMSQWQGFGYSTLLFSVAIQRIPGEIHEAAAIDGARAWRQIFSITIPLVREMTALMMIVTISGAFQVFNEVMVTTSGGPDNATQVLGTWLYRSGFLKNDFGYAAAIAVVIFVITLLLAILQVWYTNKRRVTW